eukprot:1414114-Prymnesium_polylepis.1
MVTIGTSRHVSLAAGSEKDVEEVECGAAGDRAQSTIRASVQRHTPATPRPPPRPLTRPCHSTRRSPPPSAVSPPPAPPPPCASASARRRRLLLWLEAGVRA